MNAATRPAIPVLCYGRGPACRAAGEHVRTVLDPRGHGGGGGAATVAVFPPGARRCDFVSTLLGALFVAGILTAATVYFHYHPAPLSRYLAMLWPLLFLLAFFLAMLAVAYDQACRQVEFEIDPDEVVRLSFGPFGVRRRRWARTSVVDVTVVCHVSGSHPRVVLRTADRRRHDLLCPGAAGGLRDHAEDVAQHLRRALRACTPNRTPTLPDVGTASEMTAREA